jgi:hypothetical protein
VSPYFESVLARDVRYRLLRNLIIQLLGFAVQLDQYFLLLGGQPVLVAVVGIGLADLFTQA